MLDFPAPRYPKLKRPKSVEELMPKARKIVNSTPGSSFMSLRPDYQIKKGDKVITAGGIYGTVVGVKEKEAILIVEIDKNVKVELSKTSIAKKLD